MKTAIECRLVNKSFIRSAQQTTLKQRILHRGSRGSQHLPVLQDLSLSIPKGSTFGIIGNNGAGKSTLLKLISGILVPDSGDIEVNGRLSALLELGAGFHPELTGRENVMLNGAILGLTRKSLAEKMEAIVEFSGLENHIDEPIKNYSSGMTARLGFSVAINVDPDVLLIDEVLSVGDIDFQRKAQEKFEEVRSAGRTVVIVSHGLGQVGSICDTIAWIDQGRVKSIGDPTPVLHAYVEANTINRPGVVEPIVSEAAIRSVLVSPPLVEMNGSIELAIDIRHPQGTDLMLNVVVRTPEGLVLSELRRRVPRSDDRDQSLRFEIADLPLGPGTYALEVGLLDGTGTVWLARFDNERVFSVAGSSNWHDAGVLALRGDLR